MQRNEAYFDSYKIEIFLLGALSPNQRVKARRDLKGLYQWIVFYENGNQGFSTSSDYWNGIEKMKTYFELSIENLYYRESSIEENYNRLIELVELIKSSECVLNLYLDLKSLVQ